MSQGVTCPALLGSSGGAAISWAAKSLKIVPLSTAEAECAVLSLGCKDAMFVIQATPLRASPAQRNKPSVINGFSDNTAASAPQYR